MYIWKYIYIYSQAWIYIYIYKGEKMIETKMSKHSSKQSRDRSDEENCVQRINMKWKE